MLIHAGFKHYKFQERRCVLNGFLQQYQRLRMLALVIAELRQEVENPEYGGWRLFVYLFSLRMYVRPYTFCTAVEVSISTQISKIRFHKLNDGRSFGRLCQETLDVGEKRRDTFSQHGLDVVIDYLGKNRSLNSEHRVRNNNHDHTLRIVQFQALQHIGSRVGLFQFGEHLQSLAAVLFRESYQGSSKSFASAQ